jgi:asparagine synthase (glutamine-hydrolysing)
MCGITGIAYFDSSRKIQRLELNRMTDILVHRGPDDRGLFIDGNVGLGFRRLSIIDLNTGNQPLSNEDETIWIVFNGEIYNHLELRSSLISKGHIYRTKTDTESIIHLYEEYAEECVNYLRGMFSFVIWDSDKKSLFCARDRFGIKPFYYLANHKSFVWGSEIKTILASSGFEKKINLSALNEYLTYGYISHEHSIFEGVKKLQPGHFMIVKMTSPGEIVIKKYWQIKYEPAYNISESTWIERIQYSLNEAVKIRLMSDVPLGAFLSGGVDSSSIVALMAKNSEMPIKTFSIGFKENEFDETHFARQIAEKYHTEHYEQIIEPESISMLPLLVGAFDEPFADSSAIPTYYVSKFAREKVKVILSGDGGDELFAGYDSYDRFISINNKNIMPPSLKNLIFSSIFRILPDSVKGKKIIYYLSKNNKLASVYSALWHDFERRNLLKADLFGFVNYDLPESKRAIELSDYLKYADFTSSLQWLDLKTYLPDDILTKVDRTSMLNSLEVRVPILDHKFAELSFNIPSDLKYNTSSRKYIFKKAMASFLTPDVIKHKKQGFHIPLSKWFRNDLNEYIDDKINASNANLNQYFNMSYVESIKRIHKKGQRDFNSKLWSLLVFDVWYEQSFKI